MSGGEIASQGDADGPVAQWPERINLPRQIAWTCPCCEHRHFELLVRNVVTKEITEGSAGPAG
jgi:hypothetical protein